METQLTGSKRIDKMRGIYKQAREFLHEIAPSEVKENKELEKYLNIKKEFTTKNEILFMLLGSLQNRQMSANVIGFNKEERQHIFKELLFDYDCRQVLNTYNHETLFEKFMEKFVIKNAESKSNLWKQYAKSIISACTFLDTFESAEDFDNFVERFTYNELSAAALPMLLEKEIFGLGFPLACDFLKGLGYSGYPKPDVHIKDIFYALDLCEYDDFSAYKAVIEMAKAVGDTPYNVDKIFWLIGSGYFYIHGIRVSRSKNQFIEMAKDNPLNCKI